MNKDGAGPIWRQGASSEQIHKSLQLGYFISLLSYFN